MMFAYNADKQAYLKDPKAGPYADLVEAAEICPAQCIHPGKPLDPNEPGLEELIVVSLRIMYAIRSYYDEHVDELPHCVTGRLGTGGLEFLFVFLLQFLEFRCRRRALFLDDPLVITSYSIHYTKLYDDHAGEVH